MKKQGKRWMLVAIALLALITVALPLVGCKNAADGTGDTHTHSYDETKWKSDATGHWHPATCEHTDQKGSFATHSYGDWEGDVNTYKVTEKCTVCGQSREIPDFVYVKGGAVDGTSMESGVFAGRTVTLSDFFIGKYEVTQEEYEKYCNYTGGGDKKPSEKYGDGDNYPAYYVSWYDAVVYCNKRSIKEGLTPCYKKGSDTNPDNWGAVPTSSDAGWNAITCDLDAGGYRLPTEAECEYAARGGNQSEGAWNYTYAGGNEIDNVAWYGNSENKTHEVGKKEANSLGLYDMSGNVFEWCWDWHDDAPKAGDGGSTSVTDPTGPESGSSRVGRGGCWSDSASGCRVSVRGFVSPNYSGNILGFRVVRPAN